MFNFLEKNIQSKTKNLEELKMRTICEYENWFIAEENGEFFVAQTGQETKKVELVKSFTPEEYRAISLSEFLSLCKENDFCGELSDRSAYCFWKIISLPASNFVESFYLDKEKIKNALICLCNNGIDADECLSLIHI